MKTAVALEQITDRGKFELLATAILRGSSDEYRAIIHTGINAEGEPVKSPVDGICLVPGTNPSRFLLVEHTTTERKSLEKKWLGTKKSPETGDLFKAIREAKQIRDKSETDVRFTVILTTNQHISDSLYQRVTMAASAASVDLDIWDQSRLVDYLDNKPEGHWLRKLHLGIEAEQLSYSLLRDIAKQSMQAYLHEMLSPPETWIERAYDSAKNGDDTQADASMLLLIGESGFGKSTEAYERVNKHISAGGIGLWLPAEVIADCMSIVDALECVLHRVCPSLLPDSGRQIYALLPDNERILLVVDDINRASSPSNLLRRLIAWALPKKNNNSGVQCDTVAPLLLVIPLWPRFWSQYSYTNSNPNIQSLYIGSMSTDEGQAAVSRCCELADYSITTDLAKNLAERMGNDPILIGMFGDIIKHHQSKPLSEYAENVLEQYVILKLQEIGTSLSGNHLPVEYNSALLELANYQLQHRSLYPLWSEIEGWLQASPESLYALRELLKTETICRSSSDGVFSFRHDRLQQYFLTRSILSKLMREEYQDDALWDPFFTGILGEAIAQLDENVETTLDIVRTRSPQALFESLQYASEFNRMPLPSTFYDSILTWLKEEVCSGNVIESVLEGVSMNLMGVDSDWVRQLTEYLPETQVILLARLRNGCAISGAKFFARSFMLPSLNDTFIDNIIERAMQNQPELITQETLRLLNDSLLDDNIRCGTLTLAGLLGNPVFSGILTCWQGAKSMDDVLPAALWAAARCGFNDPKRALGPIIEYWTNMPSIGKKNRYSDIEKVAEEVKLAFSRGVTGDVLEYLIEQCEVYECLRRPMLIILEHYDNPRAFDFVIRETERIFRHFLNNGGFSLRVSMMTNKWSNPPLGHRKISCNSREHIQSLWLDEHNPIGVRMIAIRLWLLGASQSDVHLLQQVPSDSPIAQHAVWKRAELGDMSVIPDLLLRLDKELFWIARAYPVWGDALKAKVQNVLESIKLTAPTTFDHEFNDAEGKYHALSELMLFIPRNDAEYFLNTYWEYIRYIPDFVQVAIYVGTVETIALALQTVRDCPSDIDLLRFYSNISHYINGKSAEFQQEHLEHMLPFLQYLDEKELHALADICQRRGIPEWSYTHIYSFMSMNDRKLFHPSDEDLKDELTELMNRDWIFDKHYVYELWLEKQERRHISNEQLLLVVAAWVRQHHNSEALSIAAACVETIGHRSDIRIIEGAISNDVNTERIIRNTKYALYKRTLD